MVHVRHEDEKRHTKTLHRVSGLVHHPGRVGNGLLAVIIVRDDEAIPTTFRSSDSLRHRAKRFT